MDVDPATALAILGMAVVTYLPRATGVWIAGKLAGSERLRTWLSLLPGAILVSMVAPILAGGGAVEGVAALATAATAWRTRSLLPALIAGVGTVWLLRGLAIP